MQEVKFFGKIFRKKIFRKKKIPQINFEKIFREKNPQKFSGKNFRLRHRKNEKKLLLDRKPKKEQSLCFFNLKNDVSGRRILLIS